MNKENLIRKCEEIIKFIQERPLEFDISPYLALNRLVIDKIDVIGKLDPSTLGKLKWKKDFEIGWGYGLTNKHYEALEDPCKFFPYMNGQTERITIFKEKGKEIIELLKEYNERERLWAKTMNEYNDTILAPYRKKFEELLEELPVVIQELIKYIENQSEYVITEESTIQILYTIRSVLCEYSD